jgi:hypothetical protein
MIGRSIAALKRKQPWPLGVDKGQSKLMQTKSGQIQMLGQVIGEYFYTPDIGRDNWEIWNLSDLMPVIESCVSTCTEDLKNSQRKLNKLNQ